jgi:ABC-type Fe3+/spermidine/putrescine transport system ATPase subunit
MAKHSAATPGAELSVKGVRKFLGSFRLEADFCVRAGERVALVGKSGCGKTTLLRIISGLEPLDAPGDTGNIFLGSHEISRLLPEQREIGFVFQEQALFPALSVLENVTFALRVRGVARSERDAVALPWLERVGLRAEANLPVTTLSGGERQRVAFLRAIVWKPRVLLLDEPFSALDRELRSTLRSELVELHKLWPVPLMLVTHDEADLEALGCRRLVFEEHDAGSCRRVRG